MPKHPSLAPSTVSSASRTSFHSAHESRQSMYPGMQARVSDAGDSEPQRARSELPSYDETIQNDGERFSFPTPESEDGISGSGYGPSAARWNESKGSPSDHILGPLDSISNQGSNSSGESSHPENKHIPRTQPSPSISNPPRHQREEGYYDPRHGAWIVTSASKVRLRSQIPHRNSSIHTF